MDKRALRILLDAFWSPTGWKPEALRGVSVEDFEYAKSKDVMFDPVQMDHELALRGLESAIRRLDRQRMADAFLSSLSTRRLDWRSGFASYAVFQHMPTHTALKRDSRCDFCGMSPGRPTVDLNVLNFERFKWGGVRHDQVLYAAFDLQQFLKENVSPPRADDVSIFRAIIDSVRAAPGQTTSAELQSHLPKSFKSNKGERDVLVAMLGFAGILSIPGHPSYTDAFVPMSARQSPNRRFVDMSYPACWWVASNELDEAKLGEWFSHIL